MSSIGACSPRVNTGNRWSPAADKRGTGIGPTKGPGGGAGGVELVAGAVPWAGTVVLGAARAVARAGKNCCDGSSLKSEGSGYMNPSSGDADAIMYRIRLVSQQKPTLLRSLVMAGNP